jgi:hypothetical protein
MKLTKTGKEILKSRYFRNYEKRINVQECREIGKTKKQEIQDLSEIMKKMNNERKVEEKSTTIQERLDMLKIDDLEKKIKDNYNINTNKGLIIRNGKEFKFYVESETDWNYYAKSYKYPKLWNTTIIMLPLSDYRRNNSIHDGIVNINVRCKHSYNDYTIMIADCIVTRKGNKLAIEKKYIVEKDNVGYHGNSILECIKGIEKKNKKKEEKRITLDTYITKNLYHRLTGACMAGIENFVNSHNLQDRNRMKISELLEIENDFWGKEDIMKMLEN